MQASDAIRLSTLVGAHGSDAVAFQGLSASMNVWFDDDGADASGGAVAYFDTGHAWVAAGGPIAPRPSRSGLARRFVEAARVARRRPCFFAIEELSPFDGFSALHIGTQPLASPEEWLVAVRSARTLKEQLRRARAKGVRATVTSAGELAMGTPLRAEVDGLLARWLASRRIEPMAFLVMADPYRFPEHHTYVVASSGDRVVGLLSAVPAYAGKGWLVEHLVCGRGSPNGTAETLLDALYRALLASGSGDARVTLGLAPLAGPNTVWQRLARAIARPLFDFEGLERFKARLRPSEWRDVWLVVPERSTRLVALVDALTAFAGGSLVRFAVRSLFLRPRALLWLLAVGLVPWTGLLVWLDVTHEQGVAGYSQQALAAWIAFDVVLAAALFRTALRPSYRALVGLIVAAVADGTLSLIHLDDVGLGPTRPDSILRLAAALAPFIGASTLLFITVQKARELARSGVRA
jgi:phosphatidylglycerol lysyltransferase